MAYVLLNKKTNKYFAKENKYGVCIDVDTIEEATKFETFTIAAYKECLLRDDNWYEIIKL